MKVRLVRASYFVWIIIPMAAYLTYLLLGLPHIIWSYEWHDDGQSYGDFASRWYTRCTFIGPFGSFTNYPANGKCGWVQFHKNQGGV